MSLRLILLHFIYRIVFGVGIAAIIWIGGQLVYAKVDQRYAMSKLQIHPDITTAMTDLPSSPQLPLRNGRLVTRLPRPVPTAPFRAGEIDDSNELDPFFHDFQNIKVGDTIQFSTAGETFRYFVTTIELIDSSEPPILESPRHSELTIFTSLRIPIASAAPQRFVVHARPLGQLKN